MKQTPPDKGRKQHALIQSLRRFYLLRMGKTEAPEKPNSHLQQMAGAAIALDKTHVRDIMVPRSEVVFVYEDEKSADLLKRVVESGFTRLPMADADEQKILGILHAKDLMRAQYLGNGHSQTLRDLARAIISVPESMRASALLETMRRQHVHMAAVVDEYGGIAGIVTIEDVIEEIVGEIEDEHKKTSPTPSIEPIKNGWIADGSVSIADFNRFFDTEIRGGEVDTLGGFVLSKLGRVPRYAEKLPLKELVLSVDAVSKGRIRRLKIQRADAEPIEAQQGG